jgi:DNA-binding IclR family transcriptional regulator
VADTRAAILAVVALHPEGIGPKDLAAACELEYGLTRTTLGRMVDAGQLDTDGRGLYSPVTPVT